VSPQFASERLCVNLNIYPRPSRIVNINLAQMGGRHRFPAKSTRMQAIFSTGRTSDADRLSNTFEGDRPWHSFYRQSNSGLRKWLGLTALTANGNRFVNCRQ
jgi:hypothetical protein